MSSSGQFRKNQNQNQHKTGSKRRIIIELPDKSRTFILFDPKWKTVNDVKAYIMEIFKITYTFDIESMNGIRYLPKLDIATMGNDNEIR